MDGLLRVLQAAAPLPRSGSNGPGFNPSPAADASPDWQLSAAAAVAVLAEVLFGASPAWRPKGEGFGLTSQNPVDQAQAASELDALAGVSLAEWVREEVWGVPTSAEAAAGDGASAPPTLQVQVARHCAGMSCKCSASGLADASATCGGGAPEPATASCGGGACCQTVPCQCLPLTGYHVARVLLHCNSWSHTFLPA